MLPPGNGEGGGSSTAAGALHAKRTKWVGAGSPFFLPRCLQPSLLAYTPANCTQARGRRTMLSVLSVLSKLPHIHIHITPVFFTVEPLSMRWHTILLVAGVLAGTWAAVRLAHRHGIDPVHVWRAALWILPAGLVGAR